MVRPGDWRRDPNSYVQQGKTSFNGRALRPPHLRRLAKIPRTRITVMALKFKQSAFVATVLACSLIVATPARADDYPNKAISVVVGYPAGGSVDLTARVLGEQLSEILGQSIVIENQGGAGGTIGAQRVVRAAPDGYT